MPAVPPKPVILNNIKLQSLNIYGAPVLNDIPWIENDVILSRLGVYLLYHVSRISIDGATSTFIA